MCVNSYHKFLPFNQQQPTIQYNLVHCDLSFRTLLQLIMPILLPLHVTLYAWVLQRNVTRHTRKAASHWSLMACLLVVGAHTTVTDKGLWLINDKQLFSVRPVEFIQQIFSFVMHESEWIFIMICMLFAVSNICCVWNKNMEEINRLSMIYIYICCHSCRLRSSCCCICCICCCCCCCMVLNMLLAAKKAGSSILDHKRH